jgi:CRP-like cAMP-binding protein
MKPTLTLIEKTAFLKGIDVLAPIPTEALAELAARAQEIHCDPGDVLHREGEPNRGSFLLVDGLLEQRKGRALVRVLRPGMAAGELWLGEGEPHHYTLVASQHSHVLNVTREDLLDGMLDYPEFAVAMVQSFSKVLHENTGRVLELERLVARLHDALAAAGVEPPDPRESEPETGRDSR